MNGLMLHYAGGGWEIRLANTNQVIGLVLGEQGVNEAYAVQNLAEAMQGGVEQVVEDAEFIFENAEQIDLEFVNNLFGAVDQLFLEAEVVFTAEVESLLESIVEAGEALAALL